LLFALAQRQNNLLRLRFKENRLRRLIMFRSKIILFGIVMLPVLLSACSSGAPEEISAETAAPIFQKGGCVACHVIPGVPGAVGTIGPDLSRMGEVAADQIQMPEYTGTAKTPADFIRESVVNPEAFISPECPSGPCTAGQMPSTLADLLSEKEIDTIVAYLSSLPGENTAVDVETAPVTGEAPVLTEAEWEKATQIFFERCAGCHGVLRNGATGPALTPDQTLPKGTAGLAAIIFNGTPRGMPDWGKQGTLTQEETELMAKFIQNEPPQPPEMSLEQMKASWNEIIPVDQRPTQPETTRDWENYFIVTLRDAGKVAIIDGDDYEIVNEVDSGYAVHITRMSATGRYAYVIGRDGRLALIDLWMEKPEVVARVQTCYDARSVEVSKYDGPEGDFTDQYAITGCYWPPHFVILDGQTLEPIKVVSTRSYTEDTGEYHPEPRVASILASQYHPEWIVNVKETGLVWIVNYTDLKNLTIKQIEASRFLHDGGLDATGRYFLVAANQSNQVAIVDLKEDKLAAIVDVGQVPHPGRGANWVDPEFGPVWTTPHLGEADLMSIGTDPEGNPDSAWKAVRSTPLPGAGSLFVKTHPDSPWIWVDMTLNSDPALSRTICVVEKANPSQTYKCWEVADYGRAVHFEYNKAGTQVWVSVWGSADTPGQTGEIVIYDDTTLEEVARIPDLITPTGKFNVYNTVHDIY
jgi:nitrite reductase (NO-forming)/hydroxylamine reductase